MEPFTITTYDEYIALLNSSTQVKELKDVEYYIEKNTRLEAIMNLMPSAMLIGNYRTGKFLFVSKSVKNITGDDANDTLNNHISELQKRVHPDDLPLLAKCYLPGLVREVSPLTDELLKTYVFSVNYRVKRVDGKYIQVLQRTIILERSDDNMPILTLSNLTDISNYKTDDKIVFSVSRFDECDGFITVLTQQFGAENCSESLTKTEIKILSLISNGKGAKEIATSMSTSEYTVKAHIRNIKNKLHIHKSTELVNFALSNGLQTV